MRLTDLQPVGPSRLPILVSRDFYLQRKEQESENVGEAGCPGKDQLRTVSGTEYETVSGSGDT